MAECVRREMRRAGCGVEVLWCALVARRWFRGASSSWSSKPGWFRLSDSRDEERSRDGRNSSPTKRFFRRSDCVPTLPEEDDGREKSCRCGAKWTLSCCWRRVKCDVYGCSSLSFRASRSLKVARKRDTATDLGKRCWCVAGLLRARSWSWRDNCGGFD